MKARNWFNWTGELYRTVIKLASIDFYSHFLLDGFVFLLFGEGNQLLHTTQNSLRRAGLTMNHSVVCDLKKHLPSLLPLNKSCRCLLRSSPLFCACIDKPCHWYRLDLCSIHAPSMSYTSKHMRTIIYKYELGVVYVVHASIRIVSHRCGTFGHAMASSTWTLVDANRIGLSSSSTTRVQVSHNFTLISQPWLTTFLHWMVL